MITSWDPGLKTGWCAWTDEGQLLGMGIIKLDEIPEKWAELEKEHGKTTVTIVEDFRLFHKRAKAQTGSNMPASQGIGMIKALAHGGPEVVVQASNKKQIAMKQAQIKMPSDHDMTHHLDAYLHGFYYFVGKGLIETPLQKEMREKNG